MFQLKSKITGRWPGRERYILGLVLLVLFALGKTGSRKQETIHSRLHRAPRFLLPVQCFLLVALTGVFLFTRVGTPERASAATSSYLNFQARLLSQSGAIVPDGTYNIEFKLYDSLAAGASAQGVCVGGGTDDCLWLETRTGGNKVTVKSGYLSVYLGQVTALPNINWDQDLYLTMNIGGIAGPTWDGEMSPRLKLTAVPYAFSAGQLAKVSGANTGTLSFGTITNNPVIQLPDIAGTNNVLLQSGTTLFTQGSIPFTDANGRLQQDNANFFFDDTNNTLGIGTTRTGAIDGTGNARLIVKGSGTTSSTSSLNVTDSSNNSLFYIRDDGNVGVGTTGPDRKLDILDASNPQLRLTYSDGTEFVDLQADANSNLKIIGDTAGADASLLVLPTKSDSGDPTTTQTNGGIYYNSNTNKFRCYENGAWVDCIGSGANTSGWTDDGTVVRLTTATDNVGIGTASPGTNKLHVYQADGNHLSTVIENGSAGRETSLTLKNTVGDWRFYVEDTTNYFSLYNNALGPVFSVDGNNSTIWGAGHNRANIVQGGGFTIGPAASTSGTPSLLSVLGPAHTGLTASTETIDVNLNLNRTVTFATGALSLQRAAVVQAPTYAFAGASTLTDAATLAVTGAPLEGANATLTNSHALLIQGGAATGATNAYGLTVNAPTGATNNYAAVFQGGNVGIGTTAPATTLHLVSSDTAIGGMRFENTSNIVSETFGILSILRQTSTNGNGVGLGLLGRDSVANDQEYGYFGTIIEDNTSTSEDGDLAFYTTSGGAIRQKRITIDSGGNVGIGTATPTSFKLEVAGSIGPEADNTRDLGSSANSFRTLYADTSVLTPTLDTQTATALNIGTATQNALTLGRVGATTSVNGSTITITNNAGTDLTNLLTGNLKVGDGAPTITLNGEDAYIEGTLEVDGTVQLDGAVTATANISQTGATTFSTGTGAVSLNGDTTIAANKNFVIATGTGTYTQTYNGTGNALSVTSSSTTDLNKALNIVQNGATTGTDYAGYYSNTGAGTTNVGLYATATGATNNYAAIFENGNVGIGTTGPTSFKLQVVGHVGPGTNDTYDLGSDSLRWKDLYLGGETIHLGTSTTDEATFAYNTTTNILGISTDSTTNGDIAFFSDDLYLDKSTGNVGIGTTAPGTLLQVAGSITLSGNLLPVASPTTTSTGQAITALDSSGDVGRYTSTKIGIDGLAIIAYYDVTNTAVKVIKCGNSDCSSGNTTTIVDGHTGCPTGCSTTASVGEYTAMSIGTDGFPVISYYDTTSDDLKVVKCANATCSSNSNTYTAVDTTNDTGHAVSIAIGSDGFPVISYYGWTANSLKIAKCTNASCSSSTITTPTTGGFGTSIAIGTDNNPVIAYRDASAAPQVYKCANASCTSGSASGALGAATGDGPSIAIRPDGKPIVAYYNPGLKIADCVNTSCTSATINSIDGGLDAGHLVSVTLGTDGFPIMSHHDVGNANLRVAKCGNAGCSSGTTVTLVDGASDNVGMYSSIAIPADGFPIITYYDDSNDNLKIVKCADESCQNTTGTALTGGSSIGSISQFFNNVYANQYWGKSFQIAAFDLAEEYPVDDPSINAGDVVSLSANGDYLLERATKHSSTVFGIVSTAPAITLGDWTNPGSFPLRPIALAGRVPVKVTNENGPIAIGDRLTLSSIPGVAAKYLGQGAVIGMALEPYNSPDVGKITVFVSNPTSSNALQGGDSGDSLHGIQNGEFESLEVINLVTTKDLLVTSSAIIQNLTVVEAATFNDVFVTGSATIEKLVVKDIEVTGSLTVHGGITTALVQKSIDYAATLADSIITADANDGVFHVTLPTAVGVAGRQFTIKKMDTSVNVVIVNTTSVMSTDNQTMVPQTIDGAITYSLASPYKYLTIVSDGTNWIIVGNN